MTDCDYFHQQDHVWWDKMVGNPSGVKTNKAPGFKLRTSPMDSFLVASMTLEGHSGSGFKGMPNFRLKYVAQKKKRL